MLVGTSPRDPGLEGGRSIQLSYRGLAQPPDQGKVSESSIEADIRQG
jgi:hypothetical protein